MSTEHGQNMDTTAGRYVTRQAVFARQFTTEADLGLLGALGMATVGDWLVRQNLDTFTVVKAEVFAEDFEPEPLEGGEWLPLFPDLQLGNEEEPTP